MNRDPLTGEPERTPTDGQPYYCVRCGVGFGEYMACELPNCVLESEASAEMRKLFADDEKGQGS